MLVDVPHLSSVVREPNGVRKIEENIATLLQSTISQKTVSGPLGDAPLHKMQFYNYIDSFMVDYSCLPTPPSVLAQ